MINNFKTKKILNNIEQFHSIWRSIDGGYPHDYQNMKSGQIQTLLSSIEGNVHLGKVLEIGCNTGLYSLVISNFSSHVHAVDINDENINRARLGKDYALENELIKDNITFHVDSAINVIDIDIFDTCIATLVLYYLCDNDLLKLMDFLRKNIKTLIVQCRPDRDVMVCGKEDKLGKASYTSLYNGLFKLNDNIDFFKDLGFSDIKIYGIDKSCPVIFGVKS